jgi:hypothetical protein
MKKREKRSVRRSVIELKDNSGAKDQVKNSLVLAIGKLGSQKTKFPAQKHAPS